MFFCASQTLDEIADYGAIKLFGAVGFDIALENNLLSTTAKIDTTSLTVNSEYDKETGDGVMKHCISAMAAGNKPK